MKKLTGFLLLIAFYTSSAQKVFIHISVAVADQPATPVRVQLEKPLPANTSYRLINQSTQTAIPAQLLDSMTLVFISEEKMAIGIHKYLIVPEKKNNNQPPILIEKKPNGLLVKVKDKPVFFYHIKEAMPPPDSPSYYRRSGFLHPLYSPSGKILTDDFPLGHLHQHAIFTAWTNATFKKASVDFWNQHSKKGTVEHVKLLEIIHGPVVSQIKTSLRHKSVEFGEVLKEKWTLTIYPSDDYFLFDLESEQQNTTNDTLFLNTYHYGGLAFRGSRKWNGEDPKNFKEHWNILTSEGIRDSGANATHARWVDASGKIDEGTAGVSVFNHPSNFRYPQAIRVHPSMPYWAYSPVVDGPFFIAPGAFYRAKFRYYVHDGGAQAPVIEKQFTSWAIEPNLKLVSQ
ncbi:MAG: PmoA family protein [Chitinophagaceae bacterium]|nr:PmoA family protein [Chitinophagaceae bacterium]